jgi:hypothetical protein
MGTERFAESDFQSVPGSVYLPPLNILAAPAPKFWKRVPIVKEESANGQSAAGNMSCKGSQKKRGGGDGTTATCNRQSGEKREKPYSLVRRDDARLAAYAKQPRCTIQRTRTLGMSRFLSFARSAKSAIGVLLRKIGWGIKNARKWREIDDIIDTRKCSKHFSM